jgi:hypothetical protein
MTDPLLHTLGATACAIPFDGQPGPWNAITDVPGVSRPYDAGRRRGAAGCRMGPNSHGVGDAAPARGGRVRAGRRLLAGNGEMTGVHMIAEAGAFVAETRPVASACRAHSAAIGPGLSRGAWPRTSAYNPRFRVTLAREGDLPGNACFTYADPIEENIDGPHS